MTNDGEAAGVEPVAVRIEVNGVESEHLVMPSDSLLDLLHDKLGLGEVRYGCGEGVCGTCTVLFDREPVSACLMFAVQADGHAVTTLSGLTRLDGGEEEMHPLQRLFLERGALQCGFCTPGLVLAGWHAVETGGTPDEAQIRYELVGNLCRCTGYSKIVEAVRQYVERRITQ